MKSYKRDPITGRRSDIGTNPFNKRKYHRFLLELELEENNEEKMEKEENVYKDDELTSLYDDNLEESEDKEEK